MTINFHSYNSVANVRSYSKKDQKRSSLVGDFMRATSFKSMVI